MKRAVRGRSILLFFPFIIFCTGLVPRVVAQPAAIVSGYVYDSTTGGRIIGAKVSVSVSQYTFAVIDGIYSLQAGTPGTYSVTCSKPGYDIWVSSPLVLSSGANTLNIPLLPASNPPGPANASIDSSQNPPRISIGWSVPSGPYEILYDDGIQDDFTVWAQGGNMNAVRFTPGGYPVTITGGLIHAGNPSNYPAGSNYLVPFQVAVYDASGPGGTPGIQIGNPVDIVPTVLGWIEFTFPVPIQVSYGNFYLVMIQGGNAPNALGLAVDLTQPQYRSYSRNVTGNDTWNPANGNFMIRARVNGPGGPMLMMNSSPETNILYNIWRLRQGEEMNTAVWTDLGSTSSSFWTDNSWSSLPCGPYRWAVKAVYTGNRFSGSTFSNVIGKCWTTAVTVQASLSCASTPVAGTKISLTNLVYPDTLYQGYADTSGKILFPKTWKGTYKLLATRFGYQDYSQNTSINSDTLFPVTLYQLKNPPSHLTVNEKSLQATWNRPIEIQTLMNETWESGSFSANGWTTDGGSNWVISTSLGNPAPSAMFSWSPGIENYSETLTSRIISGQNAPVLTLGYDIYLDSFGNTTLNQMAVEIWNGSAWNLLRNYDNMNGDILWRSETVDISAYSGSQFRIRFRAYGANSYDINNWNIDNISITAGENPSVSFSCVLGYYFYLNNILCGFTTDTSFSIPDNLVQYGALYNGCAVAVYASGYSQPACYPFASNYLPPPGNLTGVGIENSAYLAWERPPDYPLGLLGYNIYKDNALIHSLGDPDSLSWYDSGLNPGNYEYKVSARYDLSPYGYPGQFDESWPAGPVEVNVQYGRSLPFYESWDKGTFTFNDWTFDPSQGNWSVDPSMGNPAPSAVFTGQPIQANYSYSLVSPVFDATGLNCATIWLDYDILIQGMTSTQEEKITAEVYYNELWHAISESSNGGSSGWSHKHIDISPVRGKDFRIRFRAHGTNSGNILNWQLDNIHIYPVCSPARNLAATLQGYDVFLTWSPPQCIQGHILNEGFEEDFFPPDDWSRQITNAGSTWSHSDTSSSWGVHQGQYSAGIAWAYSHQNEWLIAEDVAVTGDLTFWSYAYQGSQHNDHYYVKISQDNGITWTVLLDMSALPLFNGTVSYNKWEQPYTVDLSPYYGEIVDIAWHADDGGAQGLWYNWAIDDCRIGSKKLALNVQDATPDGYDIYRSDAGSSSFKKMNTTQVHDTSYLDFGLDPGLYKYYVAALFDGCFTPSDTAIVDVITSVDPALSHDDIKVYPNPASGNCIIESHEAISEIIISDHLGKSMVILPIAHEFKLNLSLKTLSPGIYFLKILTDKNQYIKKIVVVN